MTDGISTENDDIHSAVHVTQFPTDPIPSDTTSWSGSWAASSSSIRRNTSHPGLQLAPKSDNFQDQVCDDAKVSFFDLQHVVPPTFCQILAADDQINTSVCGCQQHRFLGGKHGEGSSMMPIQYAGGDASLDSLSPSFTGHKVKRGVEPIVPPLRSDQRLPSPNGCGTHLPEPPADYRDFSKIMKNMTLDQPQDPSTDQSHGQNIPPDNRHMTPPDCTSGAPRLPAFCVPCVPMHQITADWPALDVTRTHEQPWEDYIRQSQAQCLGLAFLSDPGADVSRAEVLEDEDFLSWL